MGIIADIIVYIMMACALSGAIASIINSESELGKQFEEGINVIAPIFANSAGIMASIPFISTFIEKILGPFFRSIGADMATSATTILATDMGGYQLADVLKDSYEGWIMAMIVGFMAGATIVFSIPLGLPILDKRDHKYMALGIMSGLLTIPIGAFIASAIIAFTKMDIRTAISTTAEADHTFNLSYMQIFINLLPLLIFVVILAALLRFLPNVMIKAFLIFGKVLSAAIRLVLVFSIIEIFTGIFSNTIGWWGFDPIMADSEDQFRALENAGNIGIMLAGAFPMVYLIRKYFSTHLNKVGQKLGLTPTGSVGMVATTANILAMFAIVKDMPPKDKVLNISFGVTCAFLLGDHLSYTANFQPDLIPAVLIGKISAGLLGIAFAYWLAVPKALELEQLDREAGIIGPDEYRTKEK